MKYSLPIFLFLLTAGRPVLIFSQTSGIEKAKNRIYNSKTDEERLSNLVAVSKLKNSLHGDTIYFYALWAKKLAIQLKDSKNLAWAEYSLIAGDLAKGKTDSVIYKIENNSVFKHVQKTDKTLYYKIQLLKANALNRLDKRIEALDLQLKLLSQAEEEGNINAQLFALNFIGATYLNVNKQAEAKQAWLKGLEISKEDGNAENNEIEAYILSNLALLYFNTYYSNQTKILSDSFFICINKAIDLSEQNEYLGVLASSFILRGNFYGVIQQSEAGENDFKKGLHIRKKIGDPLYIVNDFAGLSNLYFSQKKYSKCIDAAKEGLTIANNHSIRGSEVISLYTVMGAAYKASGDFMQYSKTLERFIVLADSANQMNAADKIADIQTKYEVQKKETLIAKQKLDLFQRNLILYGGSILTVLLLLFLFYRFQKYKQQQKTKMTALIEEEKKLKNLAVKDAEENERKRIAAELHDNLGVQANAILHNSTLLNDENPDHKTVANYLQETAKEMLLNLRETVWAMKTADVSATDLWLRIINFMKQMGRHYTNLHFKIEGMAPEQFIISSGQALHIILVFQESVSNSVKHANATTITAKSSKLPNGWNITLTDDGKGFDTYNTPPNPDSYGLSNMQQRAVKGSFSYTIKSEINKGTTTIIEISSE